MSVTSQIRASSTGMVEEVNFKREGRKTIRCTKCVCVGVGGGGGGRGHAPWSSYFEILACTTDLPTSMSYSYPSSLQTTSPNSRVQESPHIHPHWRIFGSQY